MNGFSQIAFSKCPYARHMKCKIYYIYSIYELNFFFSIVALHSAWSNTHNTAYLKIFR
uniref:Uncharacterized protein n=1 Tax=Anguilla anguilla TaxID=7936 RepID=A0A0E9VT00_ANGAN